jgi:hypothetical protein
MNVINLDDFIAFSLGPEITANNWRYPRPIRNCEHTPASSPQTSAIVNALWTTKLTRDPSTSTIESSYPLEPFACEMSSS